MVLLKKIILDFPVTDTDGETHNEACIGIYEVYLTGRHSYLEIGFEVYADETYCDLEAKPIKVELLGNNKIFNLDDEEIVDGADWVDIAADKMVDYLDTLLTTGEETPLIDN